MTEHEDSKARLKAQMAATHARILEDVQKLKDRPEYEMLPTMVRCYMDIVIIDVELLMARANNAEAHIDRLDELIDSYKVTSL